MFKFQFSRIWVYSFTSALRFSSGCNVKYFFNNILGRRANPHHRGYVALVILHSFFLWYIFCNVLCNIFCNILFNILCSWIQSEVYETRSASITGVTQCKCLCFLLSSIYMYMFVFQDYKLSSKVVLCQPGDMPMLWFYYFAYIYSSLFSLIWSTLFPV